MDHILHQGDALYKSLGAMDCCLSVYDIPGLIEVNDIKYTVTKLSIHHGRICSYDNSNVLTNIHKSEVNKGNGFLFIFNSVTVSVIWNKAYFFLFDSHSRDASGNISENGTSVLLQFRSLTAIEKYVRSVYMKNNDYMQYDMQYIQFSQAANLANSQDNSRQLPSNVHFICTSIVNQNIARKRKYETFI